MRRHLAAASMVLVAVAVTSAALQAQPAAKTASQFYMEYRAAFAKAKKIDDILPYMATKNRKQVEDTPAGDREKMFQMIKIMDQYTDVKIMKETSTNEGATLAVEGIDGEKKKATGTVEIVKEKGEWKLGSESWSS